MANSFSFEGLEVYQAARVLVRYVYRLQQKFPQTETYALGDQIRRSAFSVISNIAESSGRNGLTKQPKGLKMCLGARGGWSRVLWFMLNG